MPHVSIIVPIYNVEKYIHGCLTSIQNQTFQDFECLCIDDGSPDNSGAIAQKFAETDARFRVIRQENAGLSVARNTGVQNATAPYVIFLDSDDYIHPQMVEFLFKTIQKYETPIVACTLQVTHDLYKPITPDLTLDTIKTEIIQNPLEAFCKKTFPTSVATRMYERTFVTQIPFIAGIYFEDVPFTTVCMDKLETLPLLHAPLYFYYRKSESIMRSSFSTQKVDSYDILIRHIHAYFKQNNPKKLPMVQKDILNQRVKMMLNRCLRKQPDKAAQDALFAYAQQKIRTLFTDGIISSNGLKWKHKAVLSCMLKHTPQTANRLCRFLKKLP